MNIIQENNWVITTKKGKGKLPLFCGNVEQVITIYGLNNIHPFKIKGYTVQQYQSSTRQKKIGNYSYFCSWSHFLLFCDHQDTKSE